MSTLTRFELLDDSFVCKNANLLQGISVVLEISNLACLKVHQSIPSAFFKVDRSSEIFTFKSSRPSSEASFLRMSISLRFNTGLTNRSSSCTVNDCKIRGILLFGAEMPGRSCNSGGGLAESDSVNQYVYNLSQISAINRILSCSSS